MTPSPDSLTEERLADRSREFLQRPHNYSLDSIVELVRDMRSALSQPPLSRRALPAPSGEMLADKLSAYIGKIRYVPDALLESAIAALRPCDESVMREVLAEEFDLVNLPQMAAATRDGEVLTEVRNNGYLGSLAPIFAALAAMQRVAALGQSHSPAAVERELVEALADSENREARRIEILEWLQEQIGTAWECDLCGHCTYHAFANACDECGKDFPTLHMLAFKLHASHTDKALATASQPDNPWQGHRGAASGYTTPPPDRAPSEVEAKAAGEAIRMYPMNEGNTHPIDGWTAIGRAAIEAALAAREAQKGKGNA